jgi:hypothetical protein
MSEVQIAIIDQEDTQITLAVPGVQGPSGAISSGGSANQVFYKVSGTNYDAGWTFIGNANVDAAAAIAGTKISPNFGAQNILTTGTNTAASFIPTSSSIPSNGIYLPAANQVAISTNGVERVEFGTSEVVFNDGGANYDFRIEGDTADNLFFVDASTDRVGIGTTLPQGKLTISNSGAVGLEVTPYSTYNEFLSYNRSTSAYVPLNSFASSHIWSDGSVGERARIDTSGRLLVGTTSDTGLATNTSPVVAGLFKSTSGAASLEHNTATTLFTAQNDSATYILTVLRGAVGDAASYNAVSLLSTNATVGGSASVVATALKTATLVTISVSGAAVRATQTSGGAASLNFTLTRIA